jgi:hypothetical protein
VRYSPPVLRYTWPLENAKWDQSYRRTVRGGDSIEETTRACAVGVLEEVAVPAGPFRAYKITCRNQRTNEILSETWFAPEVKMWVRERGTFSYGIQTRELVRYRLRRVGGIRAVTGRHALRGDAVERPHHHPAPRTALLAGVPLRARQKRTSS